MYLIGTYERGGALSSLVLYWFEGLWGLVGEAGLRESLVW